MKSLTITEVEYVAHSLAREIMTWDEPIPDFGTRRPHILEGEKETQRKINIEGILLNGQ